VAMPAIVADQRRPTRELPLSQTIGSYGR